MSKKEILEFCSEESLLLDNGLADFFGEIKNLEFAKDFLKKVKEFGGKRFISNEVINSLGNSLKGDFLSLPEEHKEYLDLFVEKFSFSADTKKIPLEKNCSGENIAACVKAISSYSVEGRPMNVKDFVNFFRSRYNDYKNILQDNKILENLSAINKIPFEKQKFSIIGMVSSKKITKNGNLIFEVEDLTGKIKVVLSKDKEDLFSKAEEIPLDSVLGFKGFGNSEIVFVNDIIFPEAQLETARKRSPFEEYALFLGDLHYGSKRFLEKDFLKFIDYVNGNVPNTPEVSKIKYIFFVGDLVTGIGNYPNQEGDLKIDELEKQFQSIADILSTIRKDIKIIISPGNHDGVRIMEPQPVLNEKFAWPLYELENVIVTENPSSLNIGARGGFEGFDVLTYHGFSYTYYANTVSRLMLERAMNAPEKIMKHLLTYRHLAPEHGSVQYFPAGKDSHFMKKIPDILVSGHTHKMGMSYFNDILLISVASWEGMTPYQEKFGNTPDHCKVPMFNLKTRAVKILDFESKEEEKKNE